MPGSVGVLRNRFAGGDVKARGAARRVAAGTGGTHVRMSDMLRGRGAGLLLAAASVVVMAGCSAIASAGPDGGAWTPPPAAEADREAQKCSVLTDPPCFGDPVERGAAPEKPPYIDGVVAPDRVNRDIPNGQTGREAAGIDVSPCDTVSSEPTTGSTTDAGTNIDPCHYQYGGREAQALDEGGRQAAGIDISPCVVVQSGPTAGAGTNVDPCDNLFGGRQAEAAPGGRPDPTPDVPAPSPIREAAPADADAVDPGPQFPQTSVLKAIRPQAVIFADRQASGCRKPQDCVITYTRFAMPEERTYGSAPAVAGGVNGEADALAPGIYGFGGGADEADPVVGTADPDAAPAPAPGGAADEVIVCVFGSGAEPFALGVEWATDAAPVHPLADGRIPVCYGTGEETDPSGFATAVLGWEDGRTVRIEVADPVAGRIPVGVVPLAGGGRPVALVVGDRPAAIDLDGHVVLIDRLPLTDGSAMVRVEVRSAQGNGQCGSCWALSAGPEAGRELTGSASPDRTASILSLTLEEAQVWADWVAGGGSLEPAVPLGPDGSPRPAASADPAASAAPDRAAAALSVLPEALCVRPDPGIAVRATGTERPVFRGLPDGSDALCWTRAAGARELRAAFTVGDAGYVVTIAPEDAELRVDIRHAGGAPLLGGPIAADTPFTGLNDLAFAGRVVGGDGRPTAVIFGVAFP